MKKMIIVFISLLVSFSSLAELSLKNSEVIANSEEPFNRRIYSYDFDISNEGVIHLVYSKPIEGSPLAQVIYMSKNIGTQWPIESERIILEQAGQISSISTQLVVDNETNTVHISYIVERDFIDHDGNSHNSGLVYQTVSNQNISDKINVSSGGFHSLMQLDEQGKAVFIREYEDFLNADGSVRAQPFPKALRIQLPLENNRWTEREHILNLPAAVDYRLANFIIDSNGRYHIAYGNKDANFLRAEYPTTNPPATANAVFFPVGAGHELIYAHSDDLITWQSSIIDDSGSLSENEFWTDLIEHQGQVNSISYRYNTDAQGIHQGSSAVLGFFNDNNWQLATLAGKTTGASAHRAGMGAKILRDQAGGFHGIWDNSPDAPIDSESAHGSTMYRYSADGLDWETRQVILAFSVEGKVRAKLHNDKLFILFLGDATNAKLVFSEFDLPILTENLMEVSTDKMFYGAGETIHLHARLQGSQQQSADLYFVATGPFDKLGSGELIPTLTTAFYYFGADFSWHQVNNIMEAQVAIPAFTLTDFHGVFNQSIAKNTEPFNTAGRYRLYSASTKAGSALNDFDLVTPIYTYDLHICNLSNCAEIAP